MSLTVAVTGPTGTFGSALMPLLQADDEVARVIGIARRQFDPEGRGWTKLEYRRGDVRRPEDLRAAFEGADVVVHLAFLILSGSASTTRAINIEGTLNAFREAAAAGVRRFVYASSVSAYGFHADNPVGMTEDWPTRPADRLFYAQEKAELEQLLEREAAAHPEMELYLLRPPIVLGPDAIGGKASVPTPLLRFLDSLRGLVTKVPLPVLVPDLQLQLIHQEDVATALHRCVLGAGTPGAYNIAAADVVTIADLAREVGLVPVSVPHGAVSTAARSLIKVPGLPSFAQWVEALSQPAVMDISRARGELGWEPRWSALEALRDTIRT